jgi:MFS transporter, SHS family, lactate transporter
VAQNRRWYHSPPNPPRENNIQFLGPFRRLAPAQRNAFFAAFLGWALDAFDFFIVIFCVSAIATEFNAKISAVTQAVFLTLAMRPVGALLFGIMAERFGRRVTLMIDIIAFSVFEVASAFAPSLKAFLILRALFGIAMGGEWGVGSALAFETLPSESRGFFSGILQEGYTTGYLLAALAYGTLFTFIGWRGMFLLGALPALLVLFIRSKVGESPAWLKDRATKAQRARTGPGILTYAGTFFFLALLMASFNSFSHGTEDLYPTFLQKNLGFSPHTVGLIGVIAAIGGLIGGTLFGALSERWGRRRTIVIASLLTIPIIPLWAYSHSVAMLAVGSFLMRFMVQGAWGVIPAHLNELSPPAVRGTFPGLAYQLGNLISSNNIVLQAKLVEGPFKGSYPPMFLWTVVIVASVVASMTASGEEKKGTDLSNTS